MSYVTGSGLTAFGRHDGLNTLDLMGCATDLALRDAGLERSDVDGLICGYSTTLPHLMLSTVFAEHYGLKPNYAPCGAARRCHRFCTGDAGIFSAAFARPAAGANRRIPFQPVPVAFTPGWIRYWALSCWSVTAANCGSYARCASDAGTL